MAITNQKDYFIIGSKLLGIYCLALALSNTIWAIELLFEPLPYGTGYQQYELIQSITSWIIPLFYVSLGVYLIRSSSALYKLIYSNQSAIRSGLKNKFMLFQKFLGLYLIITAIRGFSKILSSIFVYFITSSYLFSSIPNNLLYWDRLDSVATILLGVYLLLDGRLFLKWGFENKNTKPASDSNNENE